MLYKNKKTLIRSPNGDTEFYDIVSGFFQRDTLAQNMFLICPDFVLLMSIDADYEDDIALLTNTPVKAESLLHNPGQPARGIGFFMNTDKDWVHVFLNKMESFLL